MVRVHLRVLGGKEVRSWGAVEVFSVGPPDNSEVLSLLTPCRYPQLAVGTLAENLTMPRTKPGVASTRSHLQTALGGVQHGPVSGARVIGEGPAAGTQNPGPPAFLLPLGALPESISDPLQRSRCPCIGGSTMPTLPSVLEGIPGIGR